jgi:holo-[acyl-carrier protein] synthase
VIVGLGTDIVEVARIAAAVARHGDRFLARCFRPGELAAAGRGTRRAQALGARWAAKEALLKALPGSPAGIGYRQIEVVADPDGAPALRLHGRARAAWQECGSPRLLLSLSHERGHALAVVVLERASPPGGP